jgi:hypothetical protein
MKKEFPIGRLRLELTKRQKEQIWKATGRRVSALELGLEGERGAAEPADASAPQSPGFRHGVGDEERFP